LVKERLIKYIISQFKIDSEFKSFQELNSGHINDTYLVEMQHEPYYVLQKINGKVFPNSLELIKNKVEVSLHLQKKFQHLSQEEIQKKVLCFVPAKKGQYFYKDEDGNFWNVSVFIKDSITYEKTPNEEIAFEAGKITGEFLNLTEDVDLTKIKEILPQFHSIDLRYQQFKKALEATTLEKKNDAVHLIAFVENHIQEMLQIDKAIANNELPLRLTHSDTKISNILFSKSHQALCLIDTDTVMSGVIHFDYGDAIRTICNTIDEDGTNLEELDFNFDYFKSYTTGFLQELKNCTDSELHYLPMSIKMMPFIMGLRFLTDFLNGNVYYKVNYQKHNFDRAQNQFTLVDRINTRYSEIKAFIAEKAIA
jgi:hypothetical protein